MRNARKTTTCVTPRKEDDHQKNVLLCCGAREREKLRSIFSREVFTKFQLKNRGKENNFGI